MKKFVSLLLVLMLAIVPFTAVNAATFTPGEYEATAQGFGGDVTVKVTVDENAVTAVEITGEDETPALGGAAIEEFTTSLVGVSDAEAVEAVSGATVTSTAVKEALAKALALVDRLGGSVPLYKLGCNMEPEAALVAYRGMNP